MRIVIADRHDATRSALSMLLAPEPDVTIVGEAADTQQLLSTVKATKPNAVVLEWEIMSTAANLLADLRNLEIPLKVIALSSRPEAQQAALSAGVDGFVSKGDSPTRLLTMLRAIRL